MGAFSIVRVLLLDVEIGCFTSGLDVSDIVFHPSAFLPQSIILTRAWSCVLPVSESGKYGEGCSVLVSGY